jgi:hypothetical protein
MTQFTISIPDNKADLFLEFMRNISFVKNIEEIDTPYIPEIHKSIIRERITKNKNNPDAYITWDELESDIVFDTKKA